MAIKSLTITEDAYEALKLSKHGDESFSDAVLRLSNEKIGLAARFRGALKGTDTKSFSERIKTRRKTIDNEFSERSKIIRQRLK